MAAKTPVAEGASALAGPHEDTVPLYTEGADVTSILRKHDLRHQCFHFADVDASDTWASGIDGIVSMAWSNVGTGSVSPSILTASTGALALIGTSANRAGFLHVWRRS